MSDVDPIDWTVDEVVSFLCHNPQTPWSSSTVSNRPDPVSLEASLRENLITGEVLLHDIDLRNLHEDLGIKAFGHRSSVFRAIQYLRKRSLKYQSTQEQPNRSHDASPLSTSRVGTPQREHLASPHIRTPSAAGPTARKGKRPVEYPFQERTENSRPGEAAADSDSENQKVTGEHSENRPRESIIVDGQGRKRRRLELLPQVQESDDKKIISKPTDGAQAKEWYMGPDKFQTAQLFYPNIDEDDQSFVMLGPKFPTAQRSFVNKSLNYFYKQQPIRLHSEKGKDQWALMPYRPSDDDKERYFTLYSSKNGKVTVSQQNANKWPEFSKSQAPTEALSSSDPFAYLIQKYPAVEDSTEEVYPLYGESGSEGEYDESTWQEIDNEQQDPDYGKPTKLSRAHVETVMNDCVVEYQNKWHEDKRPKEEPGARKLWLKAKRSRSTNMQIKLFMHEIQLQERRLRKVQDTIRGNDYFAKSELNLICQSMETPIFKIMKEKWRISVLEREKCPPRIASTPEPRPKPKPRPTNDDEESLSSDSDESREDDFIDDDSDVDAEVRSNHDFSTTRSPSNISEDDIMSPSRKKQQSRTKRRNPLSLHSPSPEGPNNERSSLEGPNNEPNMDLIDLTMDTPPPDDLTIETPPLNPVPSKSPQHCSIKAPKSEMSSISPGPELGSRISVEIPKPKQEHIKGANNDLPRINDFGALAQTDWRRIEERSDRGRLLAKLIGSLPDEERAAMADSLPTYGVTRLKHHIRDALNALSRSARQVPGLSSSKNQLVMRTASLYISYVNCVHLSQEGISRHQIVNAQMDLSGFTSFFDVICKHLGAYVDWEQNQETPGNNNSTPHKKRKKEVKESRHTKLNHQNAQERVLNQEKQKEKLQKTWENMGISNDDPKHQAVSFGDPVIYLDPHNGARVKPHQLRGIQFLWRELIEDENQQGCLLAHTMGLGKTMQVISFLATVSAAVSSDNKRIRRQIPQHLHRSQTLVLCPSSLIDNWYEEFLMWTPQPQQRLGSLRKITSSIDLDKRLQTVRDWNSEGGVLIMSYDIFRTWILNKETKVRGRQRTDPESHQDNLPEEAKGRKCLPKEKHEQVKDWLLKGPSIIVADEAHKMKNSNTGIYQAAVQFRSKSRIALTGSPLANNLIDYYTMLNWIADGYLGEYKQFKANYVEPIEEGLYADSTHAERRKSLVKLQVLKEILEPKVNRADISALAGSLPPKVEFVMTIPLTKLQAEAYNLYVSSVFDGLGDVRNPKLWSWLAILGLCCNHPKCFWDKLNSRTNETNETQMPAQDREYSSPGEEPIDQVGLPDSASLVSRQKPLFAVPDLKALDLSYRTLMLDKIISESVKTGDKILVFSHSLPTLNYIEDVLRSSNRRYCRLDGRTPMGSRQSATKAFNKPGSDQVYLISTRAGGLGLNIPGANRVVIFDFQFNPVWEEQAVGRVYRLGQQKPVFVYRFISGGTYEEKIFGKAIFKTHLANRVVDKKNPVRWASKSIGEYLRPAGSVPQKDLTEFIGKDPYVLDKIIANDNGPEKIIRKITLTETLQREDNDNLTEEEKKGVEMHLSDERLKRTDPQAYYELMVKREADMAKTLAEQSLSMYPQGQPVYPSQPYPHQVSHNVGPRPLPPDMSVSGPATPANVGGHPSSTAGSYTLSSTSLSQPVTTTSRIPHPLPRRPPSPSTSQAATTAPAASNTTTAQGNYTTNPHHEVLSPESQDYESAAEEVTKSPQENPKPPAKGQNESDCKTQ